MEREKNLVRIIIYQKKKNEFLNKIKFFLNLNFIFFK
jgi:hypothetical protein